jgi:hypothetical protein
MQTCSTLGQIYPDVGVSAMLRNQWTDAAFEFAALNDRKPVTEQDDIVVLAAPDPMGADAAIRITQGEGGREAGRECPCAPSITASAIPVRYGMLRWLNLAAFQSPSCHRGTAERSSYLHWTIRAAMSLKSCPLTAQPGQ